MPLTRKQFLQTLGAASFLYGTNAVGKLITTNIQKTPVIGSRQVTEGYTGSCAKVYFTKYLDAEHLIKIYQLINSEIYGKVAIKVHTGEPKGPNIIPRDWVKAFQEQVPTSTIVETNTLYEGSRYTTEKHRETLKINGWTFSTVDIMDSEGAVNIPIRGGKHFKEISVGKSMIDYDSMIVLTHFKGHGMGGFGGSAKNIGIGCADGQNGKKQVHDVSSGTVPWDKWPTKEYLMERIVESAKGTCDFFGKKICFINVMNRMSVSCDCEGIYAKEPTTPDVGIVASTDILAVDQASVDLVYNMSAEQNKDLVERIESRHGLRQLSYMSELKMGNPQYELICIDD